MKRNLVFGMAFAIFSIGSTAQATQNPVKTNAVVEIIDDNTPSLSVPVTNPLVAGAFDYTKERVFDLLVSGNCKTGSSGENVSFTVDGEETAPDFFDLKGGEIVFAEPHPMGTITMPRGHDSLVKVTLKSVNAEDVEEAKKWVCLGIRKKDTGEYLDYLYMPAQKEASIEMCGGDIVELVPLISAIDLSGNAYAAVTPGEEISKHSKFSGITSINFSSVYRIDVQNVGESIGNIENVAIYMGDPYVDMEDVNGIDDDRGWFNYGSLGVGPIVGYEDQLVAVNYWAGRLSRSSDGINWSQDIGEVPGDVEEWWAGLKYDHSCDMWCAVLERSGSALKKGTGNWESVSCSEGFCLGNDGNGTFMYISFYGHLVFTLDKTTKTWNQIGQITNSGNVYIIMYGNEKWMCIDYYGMIFQSADGSGDWAPVGSNLTTELGSSRYYFGGCYANGYFYVVKSDGGIAKSQDGIQWTKISDVSGNNITYYKNKLYVFNDNGDRCSILLP